MDGEGSWPLPDASFDLRYVTHSGDASDDLKMQTLEQSESHRGGGSLHARYGKGEGLVEVQTFSGDLHVARKYHELGVRARDELEKPAFLLRFGRRGRQTT